MARVFGGLSAWWLGCELLRLWLYCAHILTDVLHCFSFCLWPFPHLSILQPSRATSRLSSDEMSLQRSTPHTFLFVNTGSWQGQDETDQQRSGGD